MDNAGTRLFTVLFIVFTLASLGCEHGPPSKTMSNGEPSSQLLPRTPSDIARRTFPSVVLLVMQDANGQPLSLGSGFFARSGVVATNLHVIEGASNGYAKLVGQNTKHDVVGVVAIDTAHDLTLLAVPGLNAPTLALGDDRKVVVGDQVYAVGNPRGLEGTFSQGIVSGVRKVGSDTILQVTAPISPGSSGGPVLDAQGKVIGVAVASFQGGQNLNFAIPVSAVARLLSNTHPPQPLLPISRDFKEESVLKGLVSRNTEGVLAGELLWTYGYGVSGQYTFSIRNNLSQPIKDVYCLVVFYDKDKNPIDADMVKGEDIIPPGLARRVKSEVDESVHKLTTKNDGLTPTTKVEFRVLDFQTVD